MNYHPLTIYLAGKVRSWNDWRLDLIDYDRIEIAVNDDSSVGSDGILPEAILATHHFSGPFPSTAYGHGQLDWERGTFARQEAVVRTCLEGIQRSDLLFVWADAESIYGTLVEIGYAVALGKPVYLATPIELPDHWFAGLLPNVDGWTYHANVKDAMFSAVAKHAKPVVAPKLTNPKNKFVYLLQANDHYKIGVSLSVAERVKQLQTANPHPIQTVHYVEVSDYVGLEAYLHQIMATKRTSGEWFRLDQWEVSAVRQAMDSWNVSRYPSRNPFEDDSPRPLLFPTTRKPSLRDRVRGAVQP